MCLHDCHIARLWDTAQLQKCLGKLDVFPIGALRPLVLMHDNIECFDRLSDKWCDWRVDEHDSLMISQLWK